MCAHVHICEQRAAAAAPESTWALGSFPDADKSVVMLLCFPLAFGELVGLSESPLAGEEYL